MDQFSAEGAETKADMLNFLAAEIPFELQHSSQWPLIAI